MRRRLTIVATALGAVATAALLGGVLVDGPAPAAAADELARGYSHQTLFRATGDPTYLTRAERALRSAAAGGADPALVTMGRAVLAATRHRFFTAVTLARRAVRL